MSEKKDIKRVSRIARECKFDEKRDIAQVESGLAVDITDALTTGVVKDSTFEADSNGITDPSMIIGRVSDRFDAIEASRLVHRYGSKARVASKAASDSSAAAAPSAAAPSAASGVAKVE